MDVNKKHIEKSDIKKILSDHFQEVKPFYEMVNAFNKMFRDLLYERRWGFIRRTRIVLMPDLSFNLTAKRGFKNTIELNLGVLPLVKALVINVSKLDFVCNEIPFDKLFDQDKTFDDIAHVFNAVYNQIDNYELNDEYITELLDESNLGTRNELAYTLFKKILYFLFLHEFVHIRCQHASRIKKKYLTEFQMNIGDASIIPSYKMQLHWAELEADHFGANLLVELLRPFHYLQNKQPRALDDEEAKELRQIFFVIGLLFLLFSYRPNENTDISFYHLCNHPHPCVRLANTFDVITNYISNLYIIDIQSICGVMTEVLSMLITIGQAVGIQEFEILQTNLDEITKEITTLQSTIGKSWIDKSNHVISETIVNIRKEMPLV